MSTLMSHAQNLAGNVGSQVQHTAASVGNHLQHTTNRLIPPKQREQKLNELRRFANRNPKLAAFLAAQTALTGLPLLLFIAFGISTLIISLSTCLLFALFSAFIYTFFAVGIALLFLVPTLFIASCAASCFFLWGLAVYLILQKFNEGEALAKPGTRVGDKFHTLTGGRLDRLVQGTDEMAVEMGKRSDAQGQTNSEDFEGGGSPLRQGGNGHVNGAGDWEEEWASGTQQRHKEFANGLNIKIDEVTA